MSEQQTAVLFVHVLTSLHPGAGSSLGAIDLPVARERHTQWPFISGQSLKGVLRDDRREKVVAEQKKSRADADKDQDLMIVFGPPKIEEGSDYAGALSISGARILAFPVRSAKGVFAWVTCPLLLERFRRDLRTIGVEFPGELHYPEEGQAYCSGDSLLIKENGDDAESMILEEFTFDKIGEIDTIGSWIAQNTVSEADNGTAGRLMTNLVLINDDEFTYFVRYKTEVTTRIGLNYETKTVRKGALFTEELLPPETLFYSTVIAHAGRNSEKAKSAHAVLEYAKNDLSVLQIGGDETVGKGFCAVRFVTPEEVKK